MRRRLSGRDQHNKNKLKDDGIRISNSNTKVNGRKIEKKIILSNINDTYTRLEVLLGLNLSGHTDTLTEAYNLLDESYKGGGMHNERQYRKALDKFSPLQMELSVKLLQHSIGDLK